MNENGDKIMFMIKEWFKKSKSDKYTICKI